MLMSVIAREAFSVSDRLSCLEIQQSAAALRVLCASALKDFECPPALHGIVAKSVTPSSFFSGDSLWSNQSKWPDWGTANWD